MDLKEIEEIHKSELINMGLENYFNEDKKKGEI